MADGKTPTNKTAGEEPTVLELDEQWAESEKAFPGCSNNKHFVMLDLDIFDWFKARDLDYEKRINDLLRAYIEANP